MPRQDVALDERFAAGDAHLGDTELRGDAHSTQQLLLCQHIRVAPLADALGGHAVLTAEVAELRDGHTQIGDGAAKWIGHLNTFRMYKLGNGTACRGGRGRRRRGG